MIIEDRHFDGRGYYPFTLTPNPILLHLSGPTNSKKLGEMHTKS